MRPKLRRYVYWVPLETGVYFRGIGGTVQLRGQGVEPWVERLLPKLDGAHTWGQITRGLPAAHRGVYDTILNALLEQGFVYNVDQDKPHTLSPQEQEQFAATIQYLGEWADSAEQRFERFRRGAVLVVGMGQALASTLRTLTQSGAARVEHVDLGGPSGEPAVWATLERDAYAAVLYAGSLAHPVATELAARCQRRQIPLLAGGMTTDGAMLLPIMDQGRPLCWTCAVRTLAEHGVGLWSAAEPAPVLATLLGAKLAHSWLLAASGAQIPDSAHNFIRIDPETLQETRHPALPLPTCRVCTDPAALDSGAGAAEPDTPAADRLAVCIDPVTGYLDQLDPLDLPQMPLAQVAAILPAGCDHDRVTAAAMTLADAREEALLAGLERYLVRASPPMAPDTGVLAVARTPADCLLRGGLRLAEQAVRASATGMIGPMRRLRLGPHAATEAHRNRKALHLWYNCPVELVGYETTLAPVVAVWSADRLLALRAGTSWVQAGHLALVDALHAVSSNSGPSAAASLSHPGDLALCDELLVNESLPGAADPPQWADGQHELSMLRVPLPHPLSQAACAGWILFAPVAAGAHPNGVLAQV